MKTCPRCRSQYLSDDVVCPACRGRPLAPGEIRDIAAGRTVEDAPLPTPELARNRRAGASAVREATLDLGTKTPRPPASVPEQNLAHQTPPAFGVEDSLIGRQVGSYRVVRLLGEGGMGAVYLGEHPAIGSKVAIKVLHPRFAADRAVVERFFNEARAVNLIGHENIVKILDFDVTEDHRHYYVMEFLAGRSLQSLVAGGKALALEVSGPIFLQCCRALQAAHERGIVHRDLKPDNIFLVRQLGRTNFVKLVDFGIAKLSDTGLAQGTVTGTVMGTPAYMSPEQAAGDTHSIDARSDVYSLGVVLYQMATGRLPYSGTGGSMRKVLLAHLKDPPPPPRSINSAIPRELEAIILTALEKEPDKRFQSMGEFGAALLACMQQQGIGPEPALADDAPIADAGGQGGGAVSSPRITVSLVEGSTNPPIPRTVRPRGAVESRKPRRWVGPVIIGGAAGLAVAAAVGIFIPIKSRAPEPAPAPGPTGLPAPVLKPVDAAIVPPPPPVQKPVPAPAPKPESTPSVQPAKRAPESRAARLVAEAERLATAARTQEAVERFEQALDLDPPEAIRGRALRGLAVVHHRDGDQMAALKYYLLYQPYCPAADRAALDSEIAALRAEVVGAQR